MFSDHTRQSDLRALRISNVLAKQQDPHHYWPLLWNNQADVPGVDRPETHVAHDYNPRGIQSAATTEYNCCSQDAADEVLEELVLVYMNRRQHDRPNRKFQAEPSASSSQSPL